MDGIEIRETGVLYMWLILALLSAVFAALTSILSTGQLHFMVRVSAIQTKSPIGTIVPMGLLVGV